MADCTVPPLLKLLASGSPILPLFARWAWYQLGKQTADAVRYFLTLHQLSFPAAACQLAVRNYPRVELRLFLVSTQLEFCDGFCAQFYSERLATPANSTSLIFFLFFFFSKSNGERRLHKCEPDADSSLNSQAVMY